MALGARGIRKTVLVLLLGRLRLHDEKIPVNVDRVLLQVGEFHPLAERPGQVHLIILLQLRVLGLIRLLESLATLTINIAFM